MIYGQKYNIIGEEEPEHVKMIARYVDEKMREIAQQSKGISTLKIAILAALNISDELFDVAERVRTAEKHGDKLISMLAGAIGE